MNRLALALLLAAALLPVRLHAQTATLVRDINPQPPAAGSAEASPRQLAAAGGRVVFVTSEGFEWCFHLDDTEVFKMAGFLRDERAVTLPVPDWQQ